MHCKEPRTELCRFEVVNRVPVDMEQLMLDSLEGADMVHCMCVLRARPECKRSVQSLS